MRKTQAVECTPGLVLDEDEKGGEEEGRRWENANKESLFTDNVDQ